MSGWVGGFAGIGIGVVVAVLFRLDVHLCGEEVWLQLFLWFFAGLLAMRWRG